MSDREPLLEPLAPTVEPVAVLPQYIAQQTETFILREKILTISGDEFDIMRAPLLPNGELGEPYPAFKVKGKVMSWSQRKTLSDLNTGLPLLQVTKEYLHIHSTFVVKDPEDKELMRVKNAIFKFIGSKATATFMSSTGKEMSITIEGGWLDRKVDIVENTTGQRVARITRKVMTLRNVFGGASTYTLQVAPGADIAIMIALCVAMDMKRAEDEGRG
ncbi:hypothetical protein DL93DRAFT_2058725 [Clavulina sp. PMI_390]|nr:hypothetical protein DL93DRAFT_2058725 [Clavulina sp. PMI_390]